MSDTLKNLIEKEKQLNIQKDSLKKWSEEVNNDLLEVKYEIAKIEIGEGSIEPTKLSR